MGRPDPPTKINASTLRDYAIVLAHNADAFRQIAEAMENEGLSTLDVLHFKSGKEAMEKMLTFKNAVGNAFGSQLANRSIQEIASASQKTTEAEKALKNARKPKNSGQNKREEGPQ